MFLVKLIIIVEVEAIKKKFVCFTKHVLVSFSQTLD